MTPAATAARATPGARGALAPVYAAHNAGGNLSNWFKSERRCPPWRSACGGAGLLMLSGPAPFSKFDHRAHASYSSNIPPSDNGECRGAGFHGIGKIFHPSVNRTAHGGSG